MKYASLLGLLLICAVSPLSRLGTTEDTEIHPSPTSFQALGSHLILEAESVNVSTFTVNASFYTPSLTVVSVDAYSTTVAVVEQEGFDLSTYVPGVLIILLTIAVFILILNKKKISSRS
ncbi:hypothetical protein [[Eubacterium] cellulosolvens]